MIEFPNTVPLDALLNPRAIAVIGASASPHKVGGVPISLLTKLGYAGRVIPVNPNAGTIQGLSAVPSVLDADCAIDLAIVCVPEHLSAAVLTECTRARVKAAVVFTAGFAEAGEAGAEAQRTMAQIALDGGITLLGPNCLGAMNLKARMFATFSLAPMGGLPPPGSIGLVAQSGAFGAYAYTLARKAGLGLTHWVTTGNEAGVQVADVIEWFAHDNDTRVIMAYLEGTRDGARLRHALEAARLAGKPVIVAKVGRTVAGARAALMHTASDAGDDAVFNAIFEESAAMRANTVEEFFRLGQVFATAQGRTVHLPGSGVVDAAANSIAILTVSGGVGTMMADRADELGLALPPFNVEETARLKGQVPFSSAMNPIDVTGSAVGQPAILLSACEDAVASGRYGGIVLFMASGPMSPVFWPALRECTRILTSAPGIAVSVSGSMSAEQIAEMTALGAMVYEEPTHAIDAVAALSRHAALCAAAAAPAEATGKTMASNAHPDTPAGWVITARLDPVFGPVVEFGLGDANIELLKHTTVVTAAAGPARVRQVLEHLVHRYTNSPSLHRQSGGAQSGTAAEIDAMAAAISSAARNAVHVFALRNRSK